MKLWFAHVVGWVCGSSAFSPNGGCHHFPGLANAIVGTFDILSKSPPIEAGKLSTYLGYEMLSTGVYFRIERYTVEQRYARAHMYGIGP